jgi:hypothetical protein
MSNTLHYCTAVAPPQVPPMLLPLLHACYTRTTCSALLLQCPDCTRPAPASPNGYLANGYWVRHPRPHSQITHGNTHCSRLKPRQWQPRHVETIDVCIPERCAHPRPCRHTPTGTPNGYWCGTLAPRTQTRHTRQHNFGYTNTLTASKLPACISFRCSSVYAHPLGRRSLSCIPNIAPALTSECVR